MAKHIDIDLAQQRLTLKSGDGAILRTYTISSAKNGAGELAGSYRTPRGPHTIRAKIGADMPLNAVFRGRRFTGEVYTSELAAAHPTRDWILTRILWLCGKQVGFNRGGNVDSMRRYVYIHGTPETEPMGDPASHGCIRMRSADVAELFDLVDCGTTVHIHAPDSAAVGRALPDRASRLGLQRITGIAPVSPVPALAPPNLGWWSAEGELLAAGRLLPGGNAELWNTSDATLPAALFALLCVEAARLGWFHLRILARAEDIAAWQALRGEVVSDPVEMDGKLYIALRFPCAPRQ